MNPALQTLNAIVDLLRQLGWYYDVNDCQEWNTEDTLEVPIKDLLSAGDLYRQMTGKQISGPSDLSSG